MSSVATSPYVMYRLEPDVMDRLGLHDVLFPVRTEKVEEIFDGDAVRFGLIVDELDRFVASHPGSVDAYGPVIARLAHLAGSFEGREGRNDTAARYFARGLSYAPHSFRLHVGLALALHIEGRLTPAMSQYRQALALQPHDPLVLILAARANQALGYDDVALAMLEACPAEYRNDLTFEDLYVSLGGDAHPPRSVSDEATETE